MSLSQDINIVQLNVYREIGIKCTWPTSTLKRFTVSVLAMNDWSGNHIHVMTRDLSILFKKAWTTRSRHSLDGMYHHFHEPGSKYDMLDHFHVNVIRHLPKLPEVSSRGRLLLHLIDNRLIRIVPDFSLVDVVHWSLQEFRRWNVDVNEAIRNWLIGLADKEIDLTLIDLNVVYYLMKNRVNVNDLPCQCFEYLITWIARSGQHYHKKWLLTVMITCKFHNWQLDEDKVRLIWLLVQREMFRFIGERITLRQVVEKGSVDIENVLYTANFYRRFNKARHRYKNMKYSPSEFNSLLKMYKLFIANGAPVLPRSKKSTFFLESCILVYFPDTPPGAVYPRFLDFIQSCLIRKGIEPELLLSLICRLYKRDDLHEIIDFLCNCGANVNNPTLTKKSSLFNQLRANSKHGIPEPFIYEAIKTLLRRGINVNQLCSHNRNVLHLFISIKRCCCRYQRVLQLNRSKYWDNLRLLVNAGVKVDQLDYKHRTPLLEQLRCLGWSRDDWTNICRSCSSRYFGLLVPGEEDIVRFFTEMLSVPLQFIGYLIENHGEEALIVHSIRSRCFRKHEKVERILDLLRKYNLTAGIRPSEATRIFVESFLELFSDRPEIPRMNISPYYSEVGLNISGHSSSEVSPFFLSDWLRRIGSAIGNFLEYLIDLDWYKR